MAYLFPLMNKGVNKYTTLYVKDLNYITHVQRTDELLICMEGTIYVTIANKTFQLQKGSACLIMDNTPHSYFTPKEETSKALIITLYEQDIKMAFKMNNEYSYQKSIVCTDAAIVDDVIYLAKEIIKLDTVENYLLTYGISLAILSLISNSKKKEYISNDTNFITINYVLRYIMDNIFVTQSLEKMARDLSFSKFYLSKLFSEELYINYKKYVNAMRLSGAKRLLIQTSSSVADIAKECAFDSSRTFNREFLRYFNITPTDFRKNNKNSETIDINSPYELCENQFRKIIDTKE